MPGKPTPPSVYVLGPPDGCSGGLSECSRRLQLQIHYFSQEAEFIAEALNKPPDCLIIDLDGFSNAAEIQVGLNRNGCRSVVIATATRPDAQTAIQIMERGALTLLEKPLPADTCEHYIRRAIEIARHEHELRSAYLSFVDQQSALSTRQRDILWSVLAGLPTKAIAAKLDVSNRLVELERSRLLKIFQSESTTELAVKVGQFLMLQRTLAQACPFYLSRLRSPVEREPPWAPDNG